MNYEERDQISQAFGYLYGEYPFPVSNGTQFSDAFYTISNTYTTVPCIPK